MPDEYAPIEPNEVKTTIFMELEGRITHAISRESVKEIEGHMQAEHLIEVELDGVPIWIQSGNIEYLREGDQRPKDEAERTS